MEESRRLGIELEGFSPGEEQMLKTAFDHLRAAGYELGLVQVIQRGDELPEGRRAMTLSMVNGMVIGPQAFASQALLDHAVEEELLHLQQYASGQARVFGPSTAEKLEGDIDARRKFPEPR